MRPSPTASPTKRWQGRHLARAEARLAWLLLAPSIVVILVTAIVPLGQVFYGSFTDLRFATGDDAPARFVGLDNYRQLLTFTVRRMPFELADDGTRTYPNERLFARQLSDMRRFDAVAVWNLFGHRYVVAAANAPFVRAVLDTLVFSVVSVTLELLLGLGIALVLATEFAGRGLMRTAMLIPWAIITVVSARIWEWMFQSTRAGMFNALFDRLGWIDAPVAYLTNPDFQLPAVIAIDVWKTTPFMALLLLAGLTTIPRELYEAAEVDGAGTVRRFFSVTLPLLVPTIAVALVFRTLDALRVFDLFQVVFGERRFSMASYVQNTLIANRDVGLSAAASVVIFVLILAFAIAYMRLLKVDRDA